MFPEENNGGKWGESEFGSHWATTGQCITGVHMVIGTSPVLLNGGKKGEDAQAKSQVPQYRLLPNAPGRMRLIIKCRIGTTSRFYQIFVVNTLELLAKEVGPGLISDIFISTDAAL